MTTQNQNETKPEETTAETSAPCCGAQEATDGCACGEGACGECDKGDETPEVTVENLQTALKLAEAKVIEHYDLYVRAMAELENTRRRASEEVQKAHKFGIEKFAENLLPVVDSLEKALELTKADNENPMREGMLATYRQLVHALDISGMKPIDPKGEKFDPHHHRLSPWCPPPRGSSPAPWLKSSSAAGRSPIACCVRPW